MFGAKNYMEMYSVFDANEYYEVRHDQDEIGMLEGWFAFSLRPLESVFQLAGRKWRVAEISTSQKIVYVPPTLEGLPPNWGGGMIRGVEYETARRFHDILKGIYDLHGFVDEQEMRNILALRAMHAGNVVPEDRIGIDKIGKEIRIATYAGTMINRVVEFALEDAFPHADLRSDFKQIVIEDSQLSLEDVATTITAFVGKTENFGKADWYIFLEGHMSDFQYSRFSPFIPPSYSVRHAASSHFVLPEIKKYCKRLHPGKFLLSSEA